MKWGVETILVTKFPERDFPGAWCAGGYRHRQPEEVH